MTTRAQRATSRRGDSTRGRHAYTATRTRASEKSSSVVSLERVPRFPPAQGPDLHHFDVSEGSLVAVQLVHHSGWTADQIRRVWTNGEAQERYTLDRPLFWLRDNCRCRECVNQDTGQRNFNTFAIPPDIAPTEVRSNGEEVLITWSDGHDSRYHWKFLEFYMSADHREEEKYRRIYLFGSEAAQKQPSISYDRVMAADRWASENAVALMTARLKKYGFTFVTDTPFDDPDKTKKLLERIAFIRLTHYGGFYDFIPDLAMADTAYTNQALSAHTDNTYFTDPAGLQAFHLLSHQAAPGPSTEATAGAGVGAGAGSDTNAQDAPAAGSQGGASLLVDGFHAAKVLQREDPRAFAVLTQVRLPWHASGNRGIAIAPDRRYPVLELDADADADGTGTLPLHRVRWNNDDRGVVPFHPDISPAEWYDAARKWDAILRRKDMEVWFQLEPGKVLIFDNWRVLHGRSAFTGIRRICGAYINRDDFISRWRTTNFPRHMVLKRIIG